MVKPANVRPLPPGYKSTIQIYNATQTTRQTGTGRREVEIVVFSKRLNQILTMWLSDSTDSITHMLKIQVST